MRQMSRRKLLRNGAQAVLAGGAVLSGIPASRRLRDQPSRRPKAVDYYQKLGVTPFINAAGTYTVLSASTMPDEVRAAIELAARHPVNLNELIVASGAYLAKQLRCEAALVLLALPRRSWWERQHASPWEMRSPFWTFQRTCSDLKMKSSFKKVIATDMTMPFAIAAFSLWRWRLLSNTNRRSLSVQ